MPITVLITVAIVAGAKKSAGLTEPWVARNPITVVGSSCRLVADITVSIIMFCDALVPPSSISFIAFIAMGVAALPSPKRFAAMFMVTYLPPFSLSPGKRNFTTGRKSLPKRSASPIFSIMPKSPSQKP